MRGWPICSSAMRVEGRPRDDVISLTLGELQLDAAVAALGLLAVGGVDGLKLAEARRHQVLRLNAVLDEDVDHGDGAGGGEIPVRPEGGGGDRIDVGMTVDTQYPADVGGDFLLKLAQGNRQLAHFVQALIVDLGRSLGEQHLRLKDEAVADDADVGALREDLAKTAEELRAVAGKLLHLLGK